jgi:uncharacterized membrane protein SirB2
MIEFYPEIRLVHVYAVLASGGLFLLRGIVLFAGGQWATAAPLRYLSYTIDTVLLTAALMLMTVLKQYPFVHAWLTVKVGLLAAYIALGLVAFWRGGKRTVQVGSWIAALGVFAFIVTVARARHPLGILTGLLN